MLSGILGVLGTDSDSYNIIKRIFTNEYFSKYDYIIFDTAGTINLLSSNAIGIKVYEEIMRAFEDN